MVDECAPIRFAFIWDGVMDNCIGIVYDPTGVVLRAQRLQADWSNWYDPELAPAKGLLGGDLIHAKHLWGSWYFCVFT
jgi:hypothetical protein